MSKRTNRLAKQGKLRQRTRSVDAEPLKKPAPNKANPPRPTKIQDVEDIERADSEGMAQPQAASAKRKPATAAPPTRIAATKRGKEQAAKLSANKNRKVTRKP